MLTRSRSRGEIFAGKVLAVLIWCVVTLALLTAASLGAGLPRSACTPWPASVANLYRSVQADRRC